MKKPVPSPTHQLCGIRGCENKVWSETRGAREQMIRKARIYNRPLVIAEIEQNFNINRGRFGL